MATLATYATFKEEKMTSPRFFSQIYNNVGLVMKN